MHILLKHLFFHKKCVITSTLYKKTIKDIMMTYDDQLKSDEKHPFWSNPLLYKQGGTTQENTGQDTPAFDSQTTGGEKLVGMGVGTDSG